MIDITKVLSNWLLRWPGNRSFLAWKIENHLLSNTVQYLKSVVDSSGAESVLWYKIFAWTIAMSTKSKTLVNKSKTCYGNNFIYHFLLITQIYSNYKLNNTCVWNFHFLFRFLHPSIDLLGSPSIEVIC